MTDHGADGADPGDCRHHGDIESLGRKVTASVVQAVTTTTLIDCAFAFIYSQLQI